MGMLHAQCVWGGKFTAWAFRLGEFAAWGFRFGTYVRCIRRKRRCWGVRGLVVGRRVRMDPKVS